MPTVHEVKSWPHLFTAIAEDRKSHELRINDRNYAVGDVLVLSEFEPKLERYSGRSMKVEVTYITSIENACAVSDQVLHKDYAILSIRRISDIETTPPARVVFYSERT